MKLTTTLSLLACAVAGQAASENLTVRTETGVFTGFVDPEYPNTRQFRAIPFAEPPVGTRRWLPPQKLGASDEHRYVAKFPPSCPQFVSAVESMWNLNLTQGNLIYNGGQNDTSGLAGEATSEDCLHLAVWAPAEIPPEGLPVMFFMTGGGFVMGGVDLPWQVPVSWVERAQTHIVVSVNYRVSIFGFPNARGLKDGEQNLGILDQRLALEWVRDNIAAFGGDAERIMQWGRSAGAFAADIHSYAYHEDPIAQSYYMESGSAFAIGPRPPEHSNFTYIAAHVGCGEPCGPGCEDKDGKAELDCMRQVSQTEIVNFLGQYQDRGAQPPLAFSLIGDDKVIFTNYTARSEAGLIARRPALVSFTANEFSSLVPWPSSNLTEGPYMPPVYEGSVGFMCATYNAAKWRNLVQPDEPVFRFQYAAEFPNLNVYDWLGAYHNAETPLLFGTYHLLDHIAPSTEFQAEVSRAMQDHVYAFARDPYNGPQELGWEPQNTLAENGGIVLRFGGRKSGKLLEYVDGVEIDAVCEGKGEYELYP